MSIAEIVQLIGQLVGLAYAALICYVAYNVASGADEVRADAKVAILLISLFLLPMFACTSFMAWFLTNTQAGNWLIWPNEVVFLDHSRLFANATHISFRDGFLFFIDQTFGAICFDFFDVFQWRISRLDYDHSHWPANLFIFAYRALCSISVGALLVHVIRKMRWGNAIEK